MKKVLSLLIAYFVFIAQALATTGVPDAQHWEFAGFGGGGQFSMVVVDNFTSNKVYAVPDVNSPFVSTNSGDSWSFLSTVGAVNSGYTITQTGAFVQSKNDANLMFAVDSASGGMNRSIDGGQTWTKVASFGTARGWKTIAIDKNDDNNVYSSNFSTLNKSSDKGVTWTSLGRPFDSRADAYTTQSSCTNAGASWSTSLGRCVISIRFIYHDTINEDLYIGSLKWGMVKYDLATDTQEYIDLTGTNALYNVGFDTYIDGSAVENLCVTAGHKIACTSDFSSWTYTAALTSDSTYHINTVAVHRKADTSLNIVANRQLNSSFYTNVTHYSTNGGSSWSTASRVNNTTMNPTGAFNFGNKINHAEDDPLNDSVFYLATDARIYRSDNSGQTFNEETTNAGMTVVHDIKIAPNGRIVQVAMDTGVQYSDDFGATWIQGTPSSAKGQPFVDSSLNAYGGHYWQVETAGTQEEWDAGDGKIFICATMYGTNATLYYVNYLIRSLDGGDTWTRSNSGLPTGRLFGDAVWGNGYCRAMGLSSDETKLYIGMDGERTSTGDYGGLFLSEDDGATFTRIWTTPRKVFNALAVDPTDSTGQILMFGTFGYNLYRKTGASTANYVGDANGPTQFIVDVAYDSQGTPYAVVNNAGPCIYKSVVTSFGDGSGQYGTWQLMKRLGTSGMADGIAIDPQNDKRIFVSVTEGSSPSNRRIYVTPNANEHDQSDWYDITGDFPVVGGCRALAVNYFEGTQGYLYCASNGANVWKKNLADSPASTPNRTCFGGCIEE